MFVRWKRRHAKRGRTRCEHAIEGHVRLTLVVLFAYRGEHGHPTHETIWRVGVSINACCTSDLAERRRFWERVDQRLAALAVPPHSLTSGAVVKDRENWFRRELAEIVAPLDEDELADYLELAMRRADGGVPVTTAVALNEHGLKRARLERPQGEPRCAISAVRALPMIPAQVPLGCCSGYRALIVTFATTSTGRRARRTRTCEGTSEGLLGSNTRL